MSISALRISDLQFLRRKYEYVETFLEATGFARLMTSDIVTKYTLAQIAEVQLRSVAVSCQNNLSRCVFFSLRKI